MFLAFSIHFQQVSVLIYLWSFFLLRLDNLAWKSVFVFKFASANLAFKTSAVKVLNSGIVIYLSRLWSVSFFSSSLIFVSGFVFLTKQPTLSILFSTSVNVVFVAKPLISGFFFSNSVSFALLTKLVTSGILFSSCFVCLIFSF